MVVFYAIIFFAIVTAAQSRVKYEAFFGKLSSSKKVNMRSIFFSEMQERGREKEAKKEILKKPGRYSVCPTTIQIYNGRELGK